MSNKSSFASVSDWLMRELGSEHVTLAVKCRGCDRNCQVTPEVLQKLVGPLPPCDTHGWFNLDERVIRELEEKAVAANIVSAKQDHTSAVLEEVKRKNV